MEHKNDASAFDSTSFAMYFSNLKKKKKKKCKNNATFSLDSSYSAKKIVYP